MAKKVLVLMGSPRKGGNTDMLADAFVKGAEAAGNEVTKLNVGSKKISGCVACYGCQRNGGTCVVKDDMQEVYEQLQDTDMIVFASPIYYFNLTAQIKAVIDRFFAGGTESVQSVALLLPYGDTLASKTSAPSILTYETMIGYLGWENKGIIEVPEVNDKGDILKTDALQRAEELGRSI